MICCRTESVMRTQGTGALKDDCYGQAYDSRTFLTVIEGGRQTKGAAVCEAPGLGISDSTPAAVLRMVMKVLGVMIKLGFTAVWTLCIIHGGMLGLGAVAAGILFLIVTVIKNL